MVLGLLWSILPGPLAAETPADSLEDLSTSERQTVQSHVQAGLEAYDARNFKKSLAEFKKAYAIFEHPDFVYRIALAHERLGHLEKAIAHYRQFLEMAPNADDRETIERTIRQLEGKLAREQPSVEIRTDPPGAEVRLAGERGRLGTTALETKLQPGEHTLVIAREGYQTIERHVEVERGQSLSLDYDLTPVSASDTGSPPVGSYVLLGAGALAGAGSIVSYLRFAKFRRRVRGQKACTPDCRKPETFEANVQSQKTWEAIAWTAGGVAGAALASGALWMAFGSGSDSPRSAARLAPYVTGDTVGVVFEIRPGGRR